MKYKDRPSSADEAYQKKHGGRHSPSRPSTERSSNRGRLSPRVIPVKSHLHPHGQSDDDIASPGGYVPPNASLRATGLIVTHNGLEVI